MTRTLPDGPAPSRALLSVRSLGMAFDVSAPWLERVLTGRPRQTLQAVDGVEFDIHAGQTLGLVGESGCGKSTVARLLTGLYRPTAGSIVYDGVELTEDTAEARAMRPALQMIFQDPFASLDPRWRVADIIAEPLRTRRPGRTVVPRGEARERAIQLLEQVGLAATDAERYPHQFSGGQRQRISIARALAAKPAFLVCDEPTSALDVSVQAQVLNLMGNLQREQHLTSLFISHNLAVVRHVSDIIGVMYLGRLIEIAPRDVLFAQPRHPYTRMLLDAVPDPARVGRRRTPVRGEVPNPLQPPAGCAFHPRCPRAQPRCTTERPVLQAQWPAANQSVTDAQPGAIAHAPSGNSLPPQVACHHPE